jgi:hypothetical protein
VAQCFPNGPSCGGVGGTQLGTCSATGTLPTAYANCATAGQSCRVDSINNAIGCITCLGPDHGLPADQECTTSAPGVPGTTALDTCITGDVWGPPVACGSGESCSLFTAGTCATFGQIRPGFFPPAVQNLAFSQTNIANNSADFMGATTCAQVYTVLGGPPPSLSPAACGSTPDCCSGGNPTFGPEVCQGSGNPVPQCQP